MPNLRAKTPACITTIRLSAIKFIVWVGSMLKKMFPIFSTQKGRFDTLLQNDVTKLINWKKKFIENYYKLTYKVSFGNRKSSFNFFDK